IITGTDDIKAIRMGWLSIQLDNEGDVETTFPGSSIQCETAIFVDCIGISPNRRRLETVPPSIVGVEDDLGDLEAMKRHRSINKLREARYRQPLGSGGSTTSLF